MAEDLVLHYQGVNRLLGSPARLNRALAVAIGVVLIGAPVRPLSGGRGVGGVIGRRGGRTAMDVSQVEHFHRCTMSPANARPYRVLLFVDRGGTAVLRLPTADVISEEGLAELARQTGIPLRGSWDENLSPAEMAKGFPGWVHRVTLAGVGVLDHPLGAPLIAMA